jgi:uncharacterized membrane protein
MKRLAFALPLLLAAGCAASRPYAPVRDVAYQAIGAEPFWALAIGDDRIVLRYGPSPGDRPEPQDEHIFPRTLPRTVNGVRIWRSGEGPGAIVIEARRGPCTGLGGRVYEDRVTVLLNPLLLEGCGGRVVRHGAD